MKSSPCSKCLLIPTCRHKTYQMLLRQCMIINEYLWTHDSALKEGVICVVNDLNPTLWHTDIRDYWGGGRFVIVNNETNKSLMLGGYSK